MLKHGEKELSDHIRHATGRELTVGDVVQHSTSELSASTMTRRQRSIRSQTPQTVCPSRRTLALLTNVVEPAWQQRLVSVE